MNQLRHVHLDNARPVSGLARTAVSEEARTMGAIVHRRYGTPEVLSFEEIQRPVAGPNQVLVRVHAAAASIGDHHIVTGKPYVIRLSPHAGLLRPKSAVPGKALAGRVAAVGANVTTFQVGDEVFGDAPAGAFAEYVVVGAEMLAPKPGNLSFEEAAATPWAITPLQALRDGGGLKPGQKVLINGAAGGVGTWAIQIAKALGAEVTAVCSGRNAALVRALGADAVVDYTKEDFALGEARYDVVFDTVGNRALRDLQKVLKPGGTYVSCSGGKSSGRWLFRLAAASVMSLFTRKQLKMFIVSPNRDDLLVLKQLVEAGKARPVIDRRYPLSEVREALRHVGGGHARGQVVVRIADES